MRQGGFVLGSTGHAILEPGERLVKSPCRHQQAEPVILSTGETVACVCIACLGPLSADWIDKQRATAEARAFCAHDPADQVEIVAFGDQLIRVLCAECGDDPRIATSGQGVNW